MEEFDDGKGWCMDYDFTRFEETEVQPDYKLQDAKYAKRESCWNCFRMFPGFQGVQDQATKRVS